MTILRVDTLSGIGTNGPVFDGDLEFNSQNYVILPKGTTDNRIGLTSTSGALRFNTDSNKLELYDGNQWTEVQSSRPDLNGGARFIIASGSQTAIPAGSPINAIDYVTLSTTGNAIDFGDTISSGGENCGCASATRGVYFTSSTNILEYLTISSTGNALDFGDNTYGGGGTGTMRQCMSISNSTRGFLAGGYDPSAATNLNNITYFTIASTGNTIDFGDLRSGVGGPGQGVANSTRGIFNGNTSTDMITISTQGNAADFGTLLYSGRGKMAGSNAVRGIFAGGQQHADIEYITISTLGNGTDFGNLGIDILYGKSGASSTRVAFAGGMNNPGTFSTQNRIEYVTISTTGNAIDFGDMVSGRWGGAGFSNGHGGL
jgi:hypothetical protein